jgi:hypothetical protein
MRLRARDRVGWIEMEISSWGKREVKVRVGMGKVSEEDCVGWPREESC